jgi:hypothetical protein
VSLKLFDHLGFGARIENVRVLLDGSPAFEARAGTATGEVDRLPVQPGPHTLSIVARASEPCGLFEEPRASVSVRASATFNVGDRPATIEADLYTREATSDPIRNLTVRFTGKGATLGVPMEASRWPGDCAPDDALCVLDAKAALLRSRNDWAGASCFAAKRGEAQRLRETLEDSYAAVTREGSTTGDAENAQLRARYAEAHLRSLPAEAEACAAGASGLVSSGVLERKIERSCPTPDVTAGLDRF